MQLRKKIQDRLQNSFSNEDLAIANKIISYIHNYYHTDHGSGKKSWPTYGNIEREIKKNCANLTSQNFSSILDRLKYDGMIRDHRHYITLSKSIYNKLN